MNEKQKIAEMRENIENAYKLNRVPLFIVGAGVSSDILPTMNKIFEILENLFGEKRKNSDPLNLALEVRRIKNDIFYQSRVNASRLFGTLQEDKRYKRIWEDFTENFLENGRLFEANPTQVHKDIAKYIVYKLPPAICLSLNYDGLTAKAVKEEAAKQEIYKSLDTKDPFYPCRILSSANEIIKFFSRDNKALDFFPIIKDFFPIIKLKGDVFNAVCKNEGCRYFDWKTPVYEINVQEKEDDTNAKEKEGDTNVQEKEDEINAKEKEDDTNLDKKNDLFKKTKSKNIIETALKCPGCGMQRNIELNFPGARVKELETEEIIKELIRYVVPSLSSIVVLGVSGKWDSAIIEFLRVCANERKIKIYYLDKSDTLKSLCNWSTDTNFISIKIDFKEWEEGTL